MGFRGTRSPFFLTMILTFVVYSVIAYAGYTNFALLLGHFRWVNHTDKVLVKLGDLLSGLQDNETGSRGYVITGDPDFLEPYNVSIAAIDAGLESLRTLTQDNPVQRQRLEQLAVFAASRIAFSAQSVAVRRDEGATAAAELVSTGQGREAMDGARAVIARMVVEEVRLRSERQQAVDASITNTAMVMVFGLLMVLVFSTLAGLKMTRDLHRSRQLEEDMMRARDAAETANRAKSDFLASMSHEIRTPMNAIVGMADLLSESRLDSEQAEYARILQTAGENLLGLINDVLDLSKIESGALELESVPFRLEELVDNLGETLAHSAHRKGLELICHVDKQVPDTLVGDPHRLRQVLLNLLGNAIKFTSRGVVRLEVTCDPHGPDEQVTVTFSVTDTGIGIPLEKQAGMFQKFVQLDSSTTRQYGGTGLGLSISQQIVRAMGGNIGIHSRVGEGSVFSFSLRMASAQSVPGETDMTRSLLGLKALILDDVEANRILLREILSDWGMEITVAEDGPDGIAEIQRAAADGVQFDLVLLDCRMPGMDGFQVAEELRKTPELAKNALLMLTSDNRVGDRARARELGLDAYLVKPVKRMALKKAILDALHGQTGDETRAVAGGQTEEVGRPLRILVVDDVEENRLLINAFLKKSPHDLEFAADGDTAVGKFKENRYDLVLMDMQMPIKDGYQATREIRDWEKAQSLRSTQIVALTAFALEQDEGKALAAGCDLYLSKPIRKAKLLALLDSVAYQLGKNGGYR